MSRAKRAAILVAIALAVLAGWLGLSFLESDPETEGGLAWEGAAPDVEEIFAAKRLAAGGSGNATRHSPASSHRGVDQAEGEAVRAASALDQAHARLAATLIAVSRAETEFEAAERRVAHLAGSGDDSVLGADDSFLHADGSSLHANAGGEPLARALEARQRASVEREKARREKSTEQANVRSAEERVEAAELQLKSRLSEE